MPSCSRRLYAMSVVYISAGLVEIRGHKSYLLKNITRPLLTIGTPYQGLRLEHL